MLTSLVDWTKVLQSKIHNPPTYNNDNHEGKMELLITNGSQDGLCKVENILIKYILKT
jgi:kynurenine/2-aminoadipate aminotransferase